MTSQVNDYADDNFVVTKKGIIMKNVSFENIKDTIIISEFGGDLISLQCLYPVLCVKSLRCKKSYFYSGFSAQEITNDSYLENLSFNHIKECRDNRESIFLTGFEVDFIAKIQDHLNLSSLSCKAMTLNWVNGKLSGYHLNFGRNKSTNNLLRSILLNSSQALKLDIYTIDELYGCKKIDFDKKPLHDRDSMFFMELR